MHNPAPYPALHWRAIALLTGLILILTYSSVGFAQSAPPNAPALTRIDLSAPALEQAAADGMQVYAQLYASGGQAYLLAPVTPSRQAQLARQGVSVHVLDPDSRGASYYLLYARQPGAFGQAGLAGALLQVDGRQAVARLAPEAAETLASQGFEIQRLFLHPLILPKLGRSVSQAIPPPDPVVEKMIGAVNGLTVRKYDGDLSGEWDVNVGGSPYRIATRNSRTVEPISKATQFAYEHFQSLGLPVQYHSYSLPGTGARRNVVAQQTGLTQPGNIYIITAHLDSTSRTPSTLAPGADDNASGSVGVMIAADILSQYDFGCTLRYVLFTGEEQGLYGSDAYAATLNSLGENVIGVLNLDMIGYNSDPATYLDLHTRPGNAADLSMANQFIDVVDGYGLSLTPEIFQDAIAYSDHASFWEYGFPAILAIEDDGDFTPYYHTIYDRLSTLNTTYFTNIVKASVGTIAHMGCLLEGSLAGSVTALASGEPIDDAAVSALRPEGQSWQATTQTDGGYSMLLPPDSFTVTVAAPLYVPAEISGVQVVNGLTIPLYVQLERCIAPQDLDFNVDPAKPLAGQPVRFSASAAISTTIPTSYLWDFGDKTGGSGQVITHTFSLSDVYPISLTAANCGGEASMTQDVIVTAHATIAARPASIEASGQPGQVLTRTLVITNTGGAALLWSLGEAPAVDWLAASTTQGSVPPLNVSRVTLTMQAPAGPGIYTSTLLLASNDPARPTLILPVRLAVSCAAIETAGFTYSPQAPQVSQPVTFTASASGGTPGLTFQWDFGDENAGSGQVAVHTFELQGKFPVVLTAANCSGEVQATQQITVADRPPFIHLYLPALFSGDSG